MEFRNRHPGARRSSGSLFEVNNARDAATGGRTSSRSTMTKARHAGIFEAVRRLDATVDAAERRALAEWVQQEYEREYGDAPLGFVAACFLGPPYVDHRLSLAHSIVDHFAPSDPMPAPFQDHRMLVRTGVYEFVEVYASGAGIPVRADGTPVTSTEGGRP